MFKFDWFGGFNSDDNDLDQVIQAEEIIRILCDQW